ncbi:hypothetical protein ES288_D05G278900v1 [Gossypium darwinii]|uniref:Uncharacterized protein n=1 Tax=Gossypium darwinii TaxID=34276 RepID=A0A5D2CPA1_GOSDA|nr:hypothetical protein ES288_D05G278900v1 [Gossypium darwinii]
MGKTKKELLSKAPWRGDDHDNSNKFADAKLKVTNQPGSTPKMHVPHRKSAASRLDDDDSLEIDPELRYSFQRNFQFLQRVFSIDTVVKPLPPAMAYNVSRIRKLLHSMNYMHLVAKSLNINVHELYALHQCFPGFPCFALRVEMHCYLGYVVQTFDPEGIANAQRSLGLGQEEKARRVR